MHPFACGGLPPLRADSGPLLLKRHAGPVSSDPVALSFKQHIDATDPLRTGSYSKTPAATNP